MRGDRDYTEHVEEHACGKGCSGVAVFPGTQEKRETLAGGEINGENG